MICSSCFSVAGDSLFSWKSEYIPTFSYVTMIDFLLNVLSRNKLEMRQSSIDFVKSNNSNLCFKYFYNYR